MKLSYSFAGPILKLCAAAGLPASDLGKVLATALADPQCPILSGTLFDVRASTAFAQRTVSDIVGLAYSIGCVGAELGRIALLASTDVAYGLMQMVRGNADMATSAIAVFRDEGLALTWLSAGSRAPVHA